MTQDNASPVLFLKLLGVPRIFLAQEDVTSRLKYRKGLALLGYLAVQPGQWVARERLASLLWPDLESAAARTNLRQVINNLGNLFEAVGTRDALARDTLHIRYVAGKGVEADVHVPPLVEQDITGLTQEFLAGFPAPSPEFEVWLQGMRQLFRQRGQLLLESRLAEARQQGNPLLAQAIAEQLSLLSRPARNDLDAVAGFAIEGATLNPPAIAPESSAALPEMRHVVALYCDFALSEVALRKFEMDRLAKALAVIEEFGGQPMACIGGGVMALFGLPPMQERGAASALQAVRALACLLPGLKSGIAAGQVFHAHAGHLPLYIGPAPDQARLLACQAPAGETLFNDQAAAQLVHRFSFQLAPVTQPMAGETLQAWKLSTSLPTLAHSCHRQSSLFGRANELENLLAHWQAVRAGAYRIAMIQAAAGMGKTRLLAELLHRIEIKAHTVFHIECRIDFQHRPLGAVLAWLEAAAGAAGSSQLPARQARVKTFLTAQQPGLSVVECEVLLAALSPPEALESSAPVAKGQLFEALLHLFELRSMQSPLLLLVDDLHWADMATLELLEAAGRRLAKQPVFLLLAGRQMPTGLLAGLCPATLQLGPLDQAAALALIDESDHEHRLSAQERADIVRACGGVPLLLYRLTRGRAEGRDFSQPVAELLQSELDQLGSGKDVLRMAAVLGGPFAPAMLQALLPDSDVSGALSMALAQNLVTRLPDGCHEFSHALIREAAYRSLPDDLRQRLHRHAAYLMLEQENVSAEAVARHFAEGGRWREAAEWWWRAGNEAMAREFASDAVCAFEAAERIALAENLPNLQAIRLRLGYAAQMADGFGSPRAYQRFHEVASSLQPWQLLTGERRSACFMALSGCYMGGSSQGKVEGLDIARQLQVLAHSDSERLMAAFAQGNSLFWHGQLDEARQWQERGIEIGARLLPRDRVRFCVDDPAVTCRAFLAWNLWFLGDEAGAIRAAEESVGLARRSGRVHTLCFALSFAVAVHWCREDVGEILRLGREGQALAEQHGLPLWYSVNSLFLLWAAAASGQLADKAALFDAARQMQAAYQAGITTSRWIAVRTLMVCEAWHEAEALLDVTIAEAMQHEDAYCLADIFWLKGQCLRQRGEEAAAGSSFGKARALAVEQGALALSQRFENLS